MHIFGIEGLFYITWKDFKMHGINFPKTNSTMNKPLKCQQPKNLSGCLHAKKKADISDPISFSLEEPLYESRNVLRAVEKCFLGECSEAQVIETIESKKSDIWECYGKFYLGLWAEANDEDEKAKDYIVSSMKMNALREDDIWKHVIQLHTHLRGW
mmetsp:Transcript_37745/g.47614  ORF Transcript_37745/g.47614 Transcript_37745/m.47614 type:complete len:156 (-) Transcript_37745:185-652(-)